jgi:hypothetical protein
VKNNGISSSTLHVGFHFLFPPSVYFSFLFGPFVYLSFFAFSSVNLLFFSLSSVGLSSFLFYFLRLSTNLLRVFLISLTLIDIIHFFFLFISLSLNYLSHVICLHHSFSSFLISSIPDVKTLKLYTFFNKVRFLYSLFSSILHSSFCISLSLFRFKYLRTTLNKIERARKVEWSVRGYYQLYSVHKKIILSKKSKTGIPS